MNKELKTICPNCGCNPQDAPYFMEPTHCPMCGHIFNERETLEEKIRNYVTDSIQRLEIFSDIEICSSEDRDIAHERMNERLKEMSLNELENMCNRIDFEDNYDSYYEILG